MIVFVYISGVKAVILRGVVHTWTGACKGWCDDGGGVTQLDDVDLARAWELYVEWYVEWRRVRDYEP